MAKQTPVVYRPLANQKVREARKMKGLTQRQAAEKMGMLYNTYQVIERKGNIRYDWILKFCEALDVPKSFFKDIFVDEPPIEREAPKKFVFETPKTIEEKFYGGEAVKEAESNILSRENKKTVIIEVTHTENGLINTYRDLSKPKQKQARDYINSLK